MLLDFPKTDFNLESDGGTTPLMDAVKTTNMYMVKQLVKKNSDITITDCEGALALLSISRCVSRWKIFSCAQNKYSYSLSLSIGRTAVHWAAMTENVEALKLLIRKGPDTIMDAQDNKVCLRIWQQLPQHPLRHTASMNPSDGWQLSIQIPKFSPQPLGLFEYRTTFS